MGNWFKDTAERVAVTFLESALAVFTLDEVGNVAGLSLTWQATLGLAATTAGFSFVKALIAKLTADSQSASLVDVST